MQLLNTTGNFGDKVLISGSGNQFFDISEVRFGGVSGVASEFQVVNPNLISATVPSFNSLSKTGERDRWKNNCYPNPLIVISETRNISGYVSGASGQPINFTPIPQVQQFTPNSGVSGVQVSVKGDGFLGLTGLVIQDISGYSNLTGLSNVVTGHYQLSGTGFGSDSVYLDFSVVNNTGLNFNLPSGNFDGQIKVFGTGVSSNFSTLRVEPKINITGFYPPIGEGGEFCLISGQFFFDELMHYATGMFKNDDGVSVSGSGYLVSFGGENATGVFEKVTGSGIQDNTLLSGDVPVDALTGPVQISKNLKTVSLNESGYYNNTGVYFIQAPDPLITGIKSAGNVVAPVELIGILETVTGISGIADLTGTSSTDSKSGLAFFGPKIQSGFYGVNNSDVDIEPQNVGSGFVTETSLEIDIASLSSSVNNQINFMGQNLYQSGVTGSTPSGLNSPPIVVIYEPMGPEIDECLEYFNAGSGHLSGCEQAYLLYYSGHHKFLDIESPDFQPVLLKTLFTDQAMNSGMQGLTGFCTGTGQGGEVVSGAGFSGSVFNTDAGPTDGYFVPDGTEYTGSNILDTLTTGQTGNLYYDGDPTTAKSHFVNGTGYSYFNTGVTITVIDYGPSAIELTPAPGELFNTGVAYGNSPFYFANVSFTESDENDPKCDDEDINEILSSFIGPPVDLYSTSLGQPVGPQKGVAGGSGPGQITVTPPNYNSANIPNTSVTCGHGRNASNTHLPGGTWPYDTGDHPQRPCQPNQSAQGFFAATPIPADIQSRYAGKSLQSEEHLQKNVIPQSEETENETNLRVLVCYPEKPHSKIGKATKAGYSRIALVSETSSFLQRHFRPNTTSIKQTKSLYSKVLGKKTNCTDGNGNPLRGTLRGTPIVNMGNPENPGNVNVGISKPVTPNIPGLTNTLGGIPRGNPSPTNAARPGETVSLAISPAPKTNVTPSIGVGIPTAINSADRLRSVPAVPNGNYTIVSCLFFGTVLSTQGPNPQTASFPIQPTHGDPGKPISRTPLAPGSPPPITITVPTLPPSTIRNLGPTINPGSNYPPKGTPSSPPIPPVNIQTTGVNRMTSICNQPE